MFFAMPALIKGIMYNKTAMSQAWDLVKDFSPEELEEMRHNVPKTALQTVLK